MKIIGIKLTHDGGMALIDNGELIFSYEMEKLRNLPRYSPFQITFAEMESILMWYGYDLQSIDRLVIDGWDDWHLEELHSGSSERFSINVDLGGVVKKFTTADLAGYGHMIRDAGEILKPVNFEFAPQSISYISYLHISSHIAGAYCTSPFSGRKEDSYILIWDGGTTPQLFYYVYKDNHFVNLGPLFPLMGYLYELFGAIQAFQSNAIRVIHCRKGDGIYGHRKDPAGYIAILP